MISENTKRIILSQVCENTQAGLFILDSSMQYVWVNEGFCIISGYNKNIVLGRPITLSDYSTLDKYNQEIADCVINKVNKECYFHDKLSLKTNYGVEVDADVTLWKLTHDSETYYAGLLRDVSASTLTEQTLAHLMYYDQITGLPNRNFYMSKFNESIIDTYQELVIVRFSVDRFTSIANAFSDKAAYDLLNQLAKRINQIELPHLQIFSHFTGGEFAFLFEIARADDIRPSLDILMQQFELPFLIDEEPIYLHISAGVSKYPENGNQMDKLIRFAEKAMNRVKQLGGDDILWFYQSLEDSTLLDIQFETQVREALGKGEFIPYYQPKYNLTTNKLSGFEALVRWQHPTRGLLEPKVFLPSIIKLRLSYDLFCNMLLMVAKQQQQWQSAGLFVQVCVNTDAAEFRHPNFLKYIGQVLNDCNVDPSSLHIEMTESSLMVNDDESIATIKTLRSKGFSVALDDFGTGYASLSYLHHYPFDFVKIDKSFIDNIAIDEKHISIVKAIISMAHNLHMKVIAEGIENQKQAQILQELGCEYGQGYYFGRPIPNDVATTMLKSSL